MDKAKFEEIVKKFTSELWDIYLTMEQIKSSWYTVGITIANMKRFSLNVFGDTEGGKEMTDAIEKILRNEMLRQFKEFEKAITLEINENPEWRVKEGD